MTALVWQAPHTQEVREVPRATAGLDEVLVEVAIAGICGSDVTAHKGKMGTARPGSIRGHEFAGIVNGQRVAVNPVLVCGTCDACNESRASSCSSIQIVGVHRPGGFATHVAVPGTAVHQVPADVPWETLATAEPLAQARHDVGLASANGPLDRVLVIGAGSIGGLLVQALGLSGAREIVVADPDPRRQEQAMAAGAARVAASAATEAPASFDAVFDVVGIESTRRAAVRAARNGRTIVCVGLGDDEFPISWFDVARRELRLVGANCFTPDDFEVALGWLLEGRIVVGDYRRVALSDGPGVFAELSAGRSPGSFTGKTFLVPEHARSAAAPFAGAGRSQR